MREAVHTKIIHVFCARIAKRVQKLLVMVELLPASFWCEINCGMAGMIKNAMGLELLFICSSL